MLSLALSKLTIQDILQWLEDICLLKCSILVLLLYTTISILLIDDGTYFEQFLPHYTRQAATARPPPVPPRLPVCRSYRRGLGSS